MQDPFNAFIDSDWVAAPTNDGPLSGKSFAVKDIYDLKGHTCSFGNPDWLKTHGPATKNAPVVEKLLGAGANGKGVTHTVEMAFSLIGHNPHYGTPINPNALDCDPGGSSSGSASAVAGSLVDFALGSDTGGSVRIPASHCGIYGLRPTHDRIPLEGISPLAPSLDTIGWFARDPKLLRQVGQVLLPDWKTPNEKIKLLYPVELWAQTKPEVKAAFEPVLNIFTELFGPIEDAELTINNSQIEDWFMPFRDAQGWEIWQSHKDWVTQAKPSFGPGVSDRMEWVSTITEAQRDAGTAIRESVSEHLHSLLKDGALMVFPTSPDGAPYRDLDTEGMEAFRYNALRMTSVSGLTRTPQITLPFGQIDGRPIGLSFLGWRGADEKLLALAEAIGGLANNGQAPITV